MTLPLSRALFNTNCTELCQPLDGLEQRFCESRCGLNNTSNDLISTLLPLVFIPIIIFAYRQANKSREASRSSLNSLYRISTQDTQRHQNTLEKLSQRHNLLLLAAAFTVGIAALNQMQLHSN